MPTSTLSRSRLLERLGPTVAPEQLEAALFASKAEGGPATGDELEVSVTPDRLDLLSEGGLALHLAGALGLASGGVRPRRGRSAASPLRLEVDPSVAPLRPYIAGIRVQAPSGGSLDAGLLAEAVRFQELLHATVGRDRRAMSLGIYPARRLRSPIRYTLEPAAGVRFTPLDSSTPLTAQEFYGGHPLAQRYGGFGRSGERCLTLRDAAGAVLSLPPVLNSRDRGEAAPGDRALLLEATGTRERAVREGLGLLLVVFASRGWSVRPVPVVGPDGAGSDGTGVLADSPRELPASLLSEILGEQLPSATVVARLGRARLTAGRARGGWRVAVPPWRPDLLAAVDLAEEVVLAGGLRSEDGLLPPSGNRGRRRPESAFRRQVEELLLGLGFVQPLTTVLVSDAAAERLGATEAIRLANPVSREYAVVRDRLLLSHLDVLGRNTRHGYPQRFAEVAPVVVRAPGADSGGETRTRAGFVIAAEGAGFADAASTVEYLLRAFDVGSVREPAELPGTIAGRAARVRVAGETVAELGELHPKLLSALGVPVPAVWAEIDLTSLGPLAARRVSTK
jgi:phenylalanyl-tRNA synthetase beta chain